jgi:ComF family protein
MSVSEKIESIYDAGLALFYPQACEVCKASVEKRAGGVACAACWEETELYSDGITCCWKCGESMPKSQNVIDVEAIRCGRCSEHSYDIARAVGIYEKALRASVLALKRRPAAPPRALELLLSLARAAPLSDATRIVEVPLHSQRMSERGFNQTAVLAQFLSKRTGLPFDPYVIERTRHSERHRAGMDVRQRMESVENAFEVRKPRLVTGEVILLVDDVLTTGATVSACAAALKNAHAKAVYVVCLARPREYRAS